MGNNSRKLALRRQSIRTLTDSELRIAHGGVPSAAPGATDVAGTSANPSGGNVLQTSVRAVTGVVAGVTHILNPSGGRGLTGILNPSGGKNNPSGG